MFKIREFAQLGQISVKTLRYYDQLGLLKPAHTDPGSGYRYYTAEQLLDLNRVLAYKELGFTLEQIADLLDEHLPCDQLRGMFRLKQAQIEGVIAEEQERLARIEGRLRQIEYQQDAPPVLDVVIKSMAPQRVVSQRLEASVSVIPAVRSRLEDHLLQGGVRNAAALPYWVLWHTCEQCDETIDLEIAYPVPDDFETDPLYPISYFVGMETVATLRHVCRPGRFCQASATLAAWIATHDYQLIGDQPWREQFLTTTDTNTTIAEVQIPVHRRSTLGDTRRVLRSLR